MRRARYEKSLRRRAQSPGKSHLLGSSKKGDDIVPVPGTKHLHYLEENIAAGCVNCIRQRSRGSRYADWMMATVDRTYAQHMVRSRCIR
jgi:hypothetical protein